MPKYTERQKELLREYRTLRDRANERLRALEKLSNNPDFENVLGYAYRLVERDVKELGLGDVSKVRYRTPKNTNKLESALKRVKNFLDMDTSTKSGIVDVYMKNTEALNKKFGTNFTWQEMKNYLDSINWNEIKKEYGSGRVIAAIKSLRENNIKAEDIEKNSKKYKVITDSKSVEADWTKRIAQSGLNPDMLYQGTGEFVSATEDDEIPFT